MKKRTAAIALSVIAVLAFAEYKVFIDKPEVSKSARPEVFEMALSNVSQMDNINSPENAIEVDSSDALRYEYVGVSANDTDYRKVAVELLINLNKIEKINECSVKCNIDDVKEYNSTKYYKVTDRNFSSVSDVDNFLAMNISDELINSRYSEITGGPSPVFRDIDGGLYVKKDRDPGKGFEWNLDQNGEIVAAVSDTSDNSFTVNTLENVIEFVSEDNLWKINAVK